MEHNTPAREMAEEFKAKIEATVFANDGFFSILDAGRLVVTREISYANHNGWTEAEIDRMLRIAAKATMDILWAALYEVAGEEPDPDPDTLG